MKRSNIITHVKQNGAKKTAKCPGSVSHTEMAEYISKMTLASTDTMVEMVNDYANHLNEPITLSVYRSNELIKVSKAKEDDDADEVKELKRIASKKKGIGPDDTLVVELNMTVKDLTLTPLFKGLLYSTKDKTVKENTSNLYCPVDLQNKVDVEHFLFVINGDVEHAFKYSQFAHYVREILPYVCGKGHYHHYCTRFQESFGKLYGVGPESVKDVNSFVANSCCNRLEAPVKTLIDKHSGVITGVKCKTFKRAAKAAVAEYMDEQGNLSKEVEDVFRSVLAIGYQPIPFNNRQYSLQYPKKEEPEKEETEDTQVKGKGKKTGKGKKKDTVKPITEYTFDNPLFNKIYSNTMSEFDTLVAAAATTEIRVRGVNLYNGKFSDAEGKYYNKKLSYNASVKVYGEGKTLLTPEMVTLNIHCRSKCFNKITGKGYYPEDINDRLGASPMGSIIPMTDADGNYLFDKEGNQLFYVSLAYDVDVTYFDAEHSTIEIDDILGIDLNTAHTHLDTCIISTEETRAIIPDVAYDVAKYFKEHPEESYKITQSCGMDSQNTLEKLVQLGNEPIHHIALLPTCALSVRRGHKSLRFHNHHEDIVNRIMKINRDRYPVHSDMYDSYSSMIAIRNKASYGLAICLTIEDILRNEYNNSEEFYDTDTAKALLKELNKVSDTILKLKVQLYATTFLKHKDQLGFQSIAMENLTSLAEKKKLCRLVKPIEIRKYLAEHFPDATISKVKGGKETNIIDIVEPVAIDDDVLNDRLNDVLHSSTKGKCHWVVKECTKTEHGHQIDLGLTDEGHDALMTDSRCSYLNKILHLTGTAAAFQKVSQEVGVHFINPVDPRNTSTTCHVCGEKGVRLGRSFTCTHCNTHFHADYNAAKNIQKRGYEYCLAVKKKLLEKRAKALAKAENNT